MSGSSWWWCWSWLGLCSAVLAEPQEPPPAPTAAASAAPATSSPLMLSMPTYGARSIQLDLPFAVVAAEPPSTWSRLSVVELPAEVLPGIGPQRRHHALRFGLDAPRLWLRSLGLDARECAGQLRAPSRLRAGGGGGGVSVEAQLQVRLQCQY